MMKAMATPGPNSARWFNHAPNLLGHKDDRANVVVRNFVNCVENKELEAFCDFRWKAPGGL